jgi:hypothetical protein
MLGLRAGEGTMESGNFFVMLRTSGDGYTPLMAEDDVAKFETLGAAVDCAQGNLLGNHFGFEVYERGAGVVFEA